ncbi:MAG: phosphoglycerate kinase [Nannocystaceae bacterium]|nr:phosphoglycerate kinase [Nannocystaceae bacterium]
MLSLSDLDVDNRRVLVRVDFNVPLNADGTVRDDTRIRAALPTLRALRERSARLIIASHLGRPNGTFKPELAIEPVGARLAELLECEVRVPDEVVGDGVTKLVNDTTNKQVVLLQNLRFHPGETKNDPQLATALAALADAYVNDAFGACHRSHASVVGVAAMVAARAPGLLLERELKSLRRLVHEPARPFVAILGGAKVSDKLSVLVALVEQFRAGDALLIGGAMANTFLAAAGGEVGASLHEPDRFRDCKTILEKAAARDIRVVLPTDVLVGHGLDTPEATHLRLGARPMGGEEMALDIGPDSVEQFAQVLSRAKTIFWNGPMGLFENPAFAQGTLGVAKAVAESQAFSVVGGGDSVAALHQSGLADQIGHVSTGGGASLELIEGKILPGIAALRPDPPPFDSEPGAEPDLDDDPYAEDGR